MNNIVANAIRFAPRGGIVMIRTVIHSRAVEVLVIDNGPDFREKTLTMFLIVSIKPINRVNQKAPG